MPRLSFKMHQVNLLRIASFTPAPPGGCSVQARHFNWNWDILRQALHRERHRPVPFLLALDVLQNLRNLQVDKQKVAKEASPPRASPKARARGRTDQILTPSQNRLFMVQLLEIRMEFLGLLSIILGRSVQFATRRSPSSFRMTAISGVVSTVTGPGIMMSRLWTVLQGMRLTGEGIHIECLPFHRKMLFSGKGTSSSLIMPLLASSAAKLYTFCAVCFPSGEVTETCGQLSSKSF